MQAQVLSFSLFILVTTVLTEDILSDEKRQRLIEKYCLKIEDFTTPMKEFEILGPWLTLRMTKDHPCVGLSVADVATPEAKEYWRKRCSIYNDAVDLDDYDYAMTNNNSTDVMPFSMISSRGANGSMLGNKCEVLNLHYRKYGEFKLIMVDEITCGHALPLFINGPNMAAKFRCVTGYDQNVNDTFTAFFC